MTELILKNRIDRKKLNSIVTFLKSWGVDTEIRTNVVKKEAVRETPFSESFGMWADREDADIKKLRQKSYERRTKSYHNGAL